jgi:hypothetical protein
MYSSQRESKVIMLSLPSLSRTKTLSLTLGMEVDSVSFIVANKIVIKKRYGHVKGITLLEINKT